MTFFGFDQPPNFFSSVYSWQLVFFCCTAVSNKLFLATTDLSAQGSGNTI